MAKVSATPARVRGPVCVAADEGTRAKTAQHFLAEKNPYVNEMVNEMTEKYGVPRAAALGIPETLYPEYRKKSLRSCKPSKESREFEESE